MKKILFMACVAASLTACNNAGTNEDSSVNDNTTVNADTAITTTITTPAVTTYTPAEGDVTYRDGNLMVWKGNDWVKANEDVKLDNGIVVYKKR